MVGITVGIVVGGGVGYAMVKRTYDDNRHQNLELLKATRMPILEKAVFRTSCANAVLLKIHNGGGKLIEGQNWYSSVIAEAPERSSVSAIEAWQNIDVEDDYKDLIRELQRTKRKYLDVDSMKESFLKRNYIRMGIKGSLVMEVYRNDYAYYYISYPVRDSFDVLKNTAEFNELELTTIRLMKKYRKYDSLGVLELE